MKKTPEAPRAEQATKPITPVMQAFADWIKAETGVDVDVRSIQLAGTLRTQFQKSEQAQQRITETSQRVKAEAAARVERRATREQAAAEKAAIPKAPAKVKATPMEPATPRRRRAAAPITVAPATVEAVSE